MPRVSDKTIRFQATLRGHADAGRSASRVHVALPREAGARVSAQGGTMVEGTMAGFPFRAPLEADEIQISDALLSAIGARVGEQVAVEITRVGDAPEVWVPTDLREALAATPKADALWEVITPMARREWVRWITSAKQEETRVRRIEVGIDKLTKGMRRPCCFPGLNWVTKDHVSPEETWVALPGSKPKKS